MTHQESPALVPIHLQEGILAFMGLEVEHLRYEKAVEGGEIHLQNLGLEQSILTGVGVQGPKGTFVLTVPYLSLSSTTPVKVFDRATMALLSENHRQAYLQLAHSAGSDPVTQLLLRVVQASGIKKILIPIQIRYINTQRIFAVVGLGEDFRDT